MAPKEHIKILRIMRSAILFSPIFAISFFPTMQSCKLHNQCMVFFTIKRVKHAKFQQLCCNMKINKWILNSLIEKMIEKHENLK